MIKIQSKITFMRRFFPIMPENFTILHFCAAAPYPDILELLLENDTEDVYGRTPLSYAIELNHKDYMQAIIRHFERRP